MLLVLLTGCGRSSAPASVQVVNLVHRFDAAERRPPAGFDVAVHVADDVARPSIIMPVPGRAVWSLSLPENGVFRTFATLDGGAAGAAVRFRMGVSDHHVYEGIGEHTVTGSMGWTEFRTDLSAYAGFKWSLFYRPDRIRWRLVIAADPVQHAGARAVWGAPEILADAPSAQAYQQRRAQ